MSHDCWQQCKKVVTQSFIDIDDVRDTIPLYEVEMMRRKEFDDAVHDIE